MTIGAAVAINVIPGVGQVLSGALGAAFSGTAIGGGVTAFGYAAAQAVVGALTLGLTVAGVQSLGGILGLGPNAPKADTTQTALKTPRPPRYAAYGESRLYFSYSLYETASDGTAVDVGAVHDGKLTSVTSFYLADDKITLSGNTVNAGSDGRYGSGKMKLYWTDGSSPGSPFAAVAAKLPGIWTTNHRGDGVVMMALLSSPVKSKNFLDIYPNGVPVPSMVAKWQACPDLHAADPLNEAGWTWTENVVRQLVHYMLVREAPKPTINEDDPAYPAQLAALRLAYWNAKIAPSLAYWRAAQDVCDEAIALKAGGTEPRYRSCLSHSLVSKHGEVKAALLSLCDGWMATRSDGSYAIYAGKYYAPTVTIGPEHIVAYEWEGVGVDDDTAINTLVCSYVSAAHDYNSVETDAWRDEDDIAERGSELSDNLDLQTPSWGQVRRLAKRKMARTNAPFRGTITTNVAGRIARGHRYINLTIAEAGATFFDGVAEITAVTRNVATGGLTFSWVSVDPNIDAWNPATEEGDPAAVGDRVASQPLETPTISEADPQFSSDGTAAQVQVEVDAPDRDDLTWYARWKESSAAVWNEQTYSDIDAGTAVTLLVGLVPLNSSIDVAVAYQVGDGRVSEWSTTETVSTSTAGLAPPPPTELTATGGTGESSVSWRNPTSGNLAYLRVYRGPTTSFGDASLISGDIVGGLGEVMSLDDTGLSAGTYYYWVRAFNATGVGSTAAGPDDAVVT